MAPALAISAVQKGAILLAISGIAAPIAGYLFHRSAEAWRSFGRGPFAIDPDVTHNSGGSLPAEPVDPAIRAAEVRQMLEAKADRLERRGGERLDVEAETARLLTGAEGKGAAEPGEAIDAQLRAEVRQLVLARNERRLRQGLEPVDVEAETERQLADLVGSP